MPKNQNQDTPRMALRTAFCFLAMRSTASDSLSGFQLIFSSGAPASTRGIMRAVMLPIIASAMIATAATMGPWLPARAKIMPPAIMPVRMEMDVPISTRPLPPVSSSGLRIDGSTEYFTGPNRVDCRPVQNSAINSTGMLWVRKPMAASDMITISITVVITISRCFSSFSAICPARAENRKYGRMNKAGARLVYSVRSSSLTPR
ncbi:hypothetical protein D3C81_925930 [compost metagenome]